MHDAYYPQPTSEELAGDIVHWLGFNQFWWSVVQGRIEDLARPEMWEDFSEAIDQAVHLLMVPMEVQTMFSGCRVHIEGSTNANNLTYAQVVMDVVDFEQGGFSLSAGRVILPSDGWYEVLYAMLWGNLGARGIGQVKVGGSVVAQADVGAPDYGYATLLLPYRFYHTAGTEIEFGILHTGANGSGVVGGYLHTYAMINRQGD